MLFLKKKLKKMESLSLDKTKRVLVTLQQIESSIILLQDWNSNVQSPDEYLLSPDGMKNLAATCMLVEAIGEAFKKIDRETEGALLSLYPSIPWKAVKSIRDRIAHGYFEIDADLIFQTVKEDMSSLLDATRFFINRISGF